LIASPTQWEKVGRSWAEFAKQPSGTGPFKITKVVLGQYAEMSRNEAYWDKTRIPKLDKMVVYPMAESTTRVAALRSGQVDWIEVPPPDSIPSLKQAGLQISLWPYPHTYPYALSCLDGSPFKDVRVRQAINYAVDREGLCKLLNGSAKPAVGLYPPDNPVFGRPKNRYTYDPERAKALLKEAGYGPDKPMKAKIMISTSGSGQMMPIPMNEFMQQNFKAVGMDIDFDVVAAYERRFRHDVMAHVHAFGDVAPAARGFIHYGATSAFVTDNADLILMRRGLELLRAAIRRGCQVPVHRPSRRLVRETAGSPDEKVAMTEPEEKSERHGRAFIRKTTELQNDLFESAT